MPSHRHTLDFAIGLLLVTALSLPLSAVANDFRPLDPLRMEFEAVAERVLTHASHSTPDSLPARIQRMRRALDTSPADDLQRLELAAAELDFGMQHSAVRRLDELLAQGNPAVQDDALCLMARRESNRGRTEDGLALLEQAELRQLGQRRDACLLLKGNLLQKSGHYRESIEVMAAVEADSPQYAAAQFNMALAEIRNGWWSDGENRITRLAGTLPESAEVERSLVDRFYTTMGYSRLERDYYRQARHAFRQVRREGPYTERAWLGLALVSMQQRRYPEALALAQELAASDRRALPVEEAQLVVPYLYDRMRQDRQARLAYEHSIAYFERRIATLRSDPVTSPAERDRLHYDLDPQSYRAIHQVFERIDALARFAADTSVQRDIAALRRHAEETRQQLLTDAIDARRAQLHSYLSQARYGLAHVLDRANSQQASR